MRGMTDAWRIRLRAVRRATGLSLREVARLSKISYESVRGYENGRRSPSREKIRAVLEALGCSIADSNEILEAAGFAPQPTRFPEEEFPSYFFKRHELDDAVEVVPWPQFVSSDDVA